MGCGRKNRHKFEGGCDEKSTVIHEGVGGTQKITQDRLRSLWTIPKLHSSICSACEKIVCNYK